MPARKVVSLLYTCLLFSVAAGGQPAGYLSGSVSLDSSWERIIYLSHIPTFEEMYAMSNDMIISRSEIDSSGSFAFDLSFLPENEHLFRLHLVKKGDSPTSIIIGGKDENHLFLPASRNSRIKLVAESRDPPFRQVRFQNAVTNANFQKVTDLIQQRTALASESDAAKRRFIEHELKAQLRAIADSAGNHLLGLYALYRRDGEFDYASDPELYQALDEKWEGKSDEYLLAMRRTLPEETDGNNVVWVIFGGLLLLATGFAAGKWWKNRETAGPDISALSIQERKIFKLLREGASNQEISDQCNIGVTTVKSHVSSIYAKLKIRSRKEIMDLP